MTAREETARALATDALGVAPESFANPLIVLASPAWRGIEGDIWRAEAGGRAVIVKHYHPDSGFYVPVGAALAAARVAGALGVAPALLASSEPDGIGVFECLPAEWRAGGLHDVVSPAIRAATIAAKKAIQAGPRLPRTVSIFDEIDALAGIVADGRIACHRHLPVFLELMAAARAKIAAQGTDILPCHRDGNTANLMIGPGNAVRLVDFDLAANCDPYEDLGCYLIEFFDCEPEARAGFEEWTGGFDEGLFQRAMLYGMADDLRWGLIGSIMAARSPRRMLEFAKYASWRFMRLETMALSSRAGDRLRRAA